MPIGGANPPIDAVPVPLKLDQISVDREIASLPVELTLPTTVPATEVAPDPPKASATEDNQPTTTDDPLATDDTTPTPTKQGKIEMKEYGIKRKPGDDKLKFKCAQCVFRCKTRKEVNKHYINTHEPLLCDTCNKVFNTPSALSLHRYEHEEHRFKCGVCSKGFHFKAN